MTISISKLGDVASAMRAFPTPCEAILAKELDKRGIKYQFQVIIGYYIADFVVEGVVVEVDGESHDGLDAILYDGDRTRYLNTQGYRVLRIRNEKLIADPIREVGFLMAHIRGRTISPPVTAPGRKLATFSTKTGIVVIPPKKAA